MVSGVPAETVVLPPGWGATTQVARPHSPPARHNRVIAHGTPLYARLRTRLPRTSLPHGPDREFLTVPLRATSHTLPLDFIENRSIVRLNHHPKVQRNASRFHSLFTRAVIVFNKTLCCLIHRHLKRCKPKVWEVSAQFTVTRRFLVLSV